MLSHMPLQLLHVGNIKSSLNIDLQSFFVPHRRRLFLKETQANGDVQVQHGVMTAAKNPCLPSLPESKGLTQFEQPDRRF